MKPLIIGEAPAKNEKPPRPLEGRVGKRLAECCGISLDEFLHRFDRINLLSERQDTDEKGFEWDAVAAALSAHAMANAFDPRFQLHEGRIVLLLGKRVAAAFGAHDKLFEFQRIGTKAEVYVLPHPSRLNRWWNVPENKAAMQMFIRGVFSRMEAEEFKLDRHG